MGVPFVIFETSGLNKIVAYGWSPSSIAVVPGQDFAAVSEAEFSKITDELAAGRYFNEPPDDASAFFEAYWGDPFINISRGSGSALIVMPTEEVLRREDRNARLLACDWTQLPDVPISAASRSEFETYRQALRDLPATDPGWPDNISWPTEPVYTKA